MLYLVKLKPALALPLGAARAITAVFRLSPARLKLAADAGEAAPPARRRARWVLPAASALLLSGGAVATVLWLAPRPPIAMPKLAERAPPAPPRDQARRLRIVGEQLNLQTRTIGDTTFVYASTAAGLQSALSFARDNPAALRLQVVSLSAIAAEIARVFREGGFDVSEESVALDLLAINLSVKVPSPLLPLQEDLSSRIRRALAAVPALAAIKVTLTVKEKHEPFLVATMVGQPASLAFTVNGPRAIGDTVFDHFVLRKIMGDRVELTERTASAVDGVVLIVPLHGASTLRSAGGNGGALPDFRAALLN